MSQKFTVLFDLDGTLVDTAPDLMLAHNHVMKKFGYEERELSDIKKLAGGGSKVMLRKSMHEIAELSGKIKKTDEEMEEEMTKEFIKKLSNKYDYRLLNINPFKYSGKIVSSTRIRKCLKNGNIDLANKLLSRTWFIDGQVKKGKKIGRKLGYHTCNIKVKNYILPKMGIYAVKISKDDKKKKLWRCCLFRISPHFWRQGNFSGNEYIWC